MRVGASQFFLKRVQTSPITGEKYIVLRDGKNVCRLVLDCDLWIEKGRITNKFGD